MDIAGPAEQDGNGVIVSLVAPGGDRSMCSDRGVAQDFPADELDPVWLDGCEHLHVSGYALLREPVRFAATPAVRLARSSGARVSVDLSSWSAIRDFGPQAFRRELGELAPDVVFANEEEDAILGGAIPVRTAWILKRGARGCSFDGEERAPALPVAGVLDTDRAGDALAAGFIVGGQDLALRGGGALRAAAGIDAMSP